MDRETGFLSLPTELLREIFRLVYVQDPRAVNSLCLTNRRFHSIAQPLIFQRVVLHVDEGSEHITDLARLLLARPDLRENVRHLGIEQEVVTYGHLLDAQKLSFPDSPVPAEDMQSTPHCLPYWLTFMDLTEDERWTLARYADKSVPSLPAALLDKWENQLLLDLEEPFFALVIAWASQLESLDYPIPFESVQGDEECESPMILQLARYTAEQIRNSSALHGLPLLNLRVLKVSGADRYDRVGYGCRAPRFCWSTELKQTAAHILTPYFYLPNLRTIEGT